VIELNAQRVELEAALAATEASLTAAKVRTCVCMCVCVQCDRDQHNLQTHDGAPDETVRVLMEERAKWRAAKTAFEQQVGVRRLRARVCVMTGERTAARDE
jgi:hypothetical protein